MFDALKKILQGWIVNLQNLLPQIFLALVIFVLFYVLGKIFRKLSLKVNSKTLNKHPDLLRLFSASVYFFFLFFGAFLSLKTLGLEQFFTRALAGAGIVGIIAGFALKDIASNAFSGLLLFFEKPYQKGDWVQIDGHYGSVSNIGWLTTSLANKTGQEVFIANQLIYSGTFVNYSKFKKRRIGIQSDVAQYPDVSALKKMLTAEIKKIKTLVPGTDITFLLTFLTADGSFTFKLFFWIYFDSEESFTETIGETILSMKQLGDSEKINISNTQWLSDEADNTSSGNYGSGG